MTQEEKAKAYDMALERASKIKNGEDNWRFCDLTEISPALEEVFPELAESEDERIRKWLYDYISYCPNNNFAFYGGVGKDAVLNYLEKLKEEEGYEAIPVESTLEYKLGFKAGKESEKQKESLHIPETCKENTDSFTDEDERIRKGLINFLRSPFVHDNIVDERVAPWIAWIEKQKEPHYTKRNALFDKCVENCDPEVMKEVSDKVDEMLGKEQKPISSYDIVPYIDDKIAELQDMWREEKVAFDWDDMKDMIEDVARHFYQKEQKPTLPKPHKGDDNNPYDMGVSEAQEYAINRGFGIPFNDGEVFVDERYITQTIGNILRWADEHPKEQKPVDYPAGFYVTFPDGKKYYTKEMRCNNMNVKVVEPKPVEKPDLVAELKHHLATTPKEQLEKEWKELERWNNIGPTVQEFLYGKPVEWSDTNELVFKDICKHLKEEGYNGWIVLLEALRNGEFNQPSVECVTDAEMEKGMDELTKFKQFASALSDMYNIIPSHSSLRPKDIDWNNFCAGLLTYLKRNQPAEWNEEDEKMINHLVEALPQWANGQIAILPSQAEEYAKRLKSLRPQPHTVSIKDATKFGNLEYERGVKDGIQSEKSRQWKPSDEQMSMLLAVINDPNNAGSESCHLALKSIYEQLKKLM